MSRFLNRLMHLQLIVLCKELYHLTMLMKIANIKVRDQFFFHVTSNIKYTYVLRLKKCRGHAK